MSLSNHIEISISVHIIFQFPAARQGQVLNYLENKIMDAGNVGVFLCLAVVGEGEKISMNMPKTRSHSNTLLGLDK